MKLKNSHHLTRLQEMAIRDINGNCRWPHCGKYRKREDFEKQSGAVCFGDDRVTGYIHVAPGCKECMIESEEKQ